MGQTILKVDFENKKRIPNQQNNSDKGFYINKEKVCDGEATIFQTKKSGGICECMSLVLKNTFKKV